MFSICAVVSTVDASSVVMQAHTNIKMEDLFGSGVTSRTLTLEVNQEVRPIKDTPYTCTI